ncbi:MAG: hypothetical protein ACR2QJ_05175 [Geminicoccaceae bacterium]
MLDNTETINWPLLARPYGQAERALGHLAHALETTRLHQTWLWREITRASVTIVQAGGYQANVEQLRRSLIGAPIDGDDNTSGLAAARRVFLTAAPLFRNKQNTDSQSQLWPAFWSGVAPQPDIDGSHRLDDSGDASSDGEAPRPRGAPPQTGSEAPSDHKHDPSGAGEVAWPHQVTWPQQAARPQQGDRARELLISLVKELAGFADDGRRPALINLFIDLRHQAKVRHLPPHLLRLVLPLALIEGGLLPKAAPGLLGGRRLPLGMSAASPEAKPLSDWLTSGLDDLAKEAHQSHRRLAELTRQQRAWHGALIKEGLRKHARAPRALDLLAATPVLSIGLVAAHLGCSHVAAGKIIERLVDLGILIAATTRSRHKIFVAGDLPAKGRAEADPERPLVRSEPLPLVDVDAVSATLDGLFADLERLDERAEGRVRAGGMATSGGAAAARG